MLKKLVPNLDVGYIKHNENKQLCLLLEKLNTGSGMSFITAQIEMKEVNNNKNLIIIDPEQIFK